MNHFKLHAKSPSLSSSVLRRITVALLAFALYLCLSILLVPRTTHSHISTTIFCSLNGHPDISGSCQCDKPWSGPDCSTLKLLPASRAYGSRNALTAWGGNVMYDGQLYHLYVSTMTNNCSLSHWKTNSRIEHAVSDRIEGPYEFRDVAVNTYSHNAAPIKLGERSYAIVHIGYGDGPPDGGENCAARKLGLNPTVAGGVDYSSRSLKDRGTTIHVSSTLDGPWSPVQTIESCNNPAPWVHPNGTLFVACRGFGNNNNILLRSSSIQGPWEFVSTIISSHPGGPQGRYEDPFLYTNERGFHVLYHVYSTTEQRKPGHQCEDSTVSAHMYSSDGYMWHTSSSQPYGTRVELKTGEVVTVSTRERPKLFFDQAGRMTHLFTGVCSAPNCPGGPTGGCVNCKYTFWDYTLVQPLDV